MKKFNLTSWALKNHALVRYALFALLLAGVFAFSQLAQKEDPDFTFRVMTIKILWPGATAREMELQVTDKVERKLQETPWLDNVSSYSMAGEAVVFVTLKDEMPSSELRHAWGEVRNDLADMRRWLPEGVADPVINDNFGETFGAIYALTSATQSNAELVRHANKLREKFLTVNHVSRVLLIGAQREKIYIEFSSSKMAALGIDPISVAAALKAQNAMEPAGEISSHDGVARVRVSGDFTSVKSIQQIGIAAGGKIHRLGDICHVYRSYADPSTFKMRTMGRDAVGIAVSASAQGDIKQISADLQRELAFAKKQLPADVEIHRVFDESAVVKKSISEFMRALLEALVIVTVVGFIGLGKRAGLVVGLSIPLVLAGTFLVMYMLGIDLHRVSLGALIIALGLLVDDAMIAVEMMKVKLEQGWSKLQAASFAYTSTAFPMLTGTLITAAAFLPVGLAKSSAGEYTFSICVVVSIALLVSWLVAVIFTPFIGHRLLLNNRRKTPRGDQYKQGFYVHLRKLVELCLDNKKSVVGFTAALFLLALFGFTKVEQEFFPPSERPELLMDIWLPDGAAFAATEGVTREIEKRLQGDRDIANFTSYIGGSTPRFYLPLDLQLPVTNYAQIVITSRDMAAREAVLKRVRKILADDFPNSGIRIARLENGPPVGYPIQFRVVGDAPEKLRAIANEVVAVVRKNPHAQNISQDSSEKLRTINVDVDQDKARALGLSSQAISRNLQAHLSGLTVSNMLDGKRRIEIVTRAEESERCNPEKLGQLPILTRTGQFVPLGQIAHIRAGEEDAVIWRMNRLPFVIVRADVPDSIRAPDVSMEIDKQLEPIRARLPDGYRIEVGGAMEDNDKAQDSIIAVLPLMGFLIVTLLVLQLKRFKLVLLALLTAPLGIIGVTAALLVFNVPFGFVAMLGMISLAGMIMRNSVILLDQINQDMTAGLHRWDAIVDSTVRRFRPIMLTAAAAILAMIPLTRSIFWGPMAIVIMGGLLVATLLTLLFLPALYALWFRVSRPVTE